MLVDWVLDGYTEIELKDFVSRIECGLPVTPCEYGLACTYKAMKSLELTHGFTMIDQINERGARMARKE